MKDQYFGDVNDFLKYGLLRALVARDKLSLGVSWMLTPSNGGTDGKFLEYLGRPSIFHHRDPDVFDLLRRCVLQDRDRRTARIEASRLLGDAEFQSSILHDDRIARDTYFAECASRLHGRDLIFFDPDNGLEIPSKPIGRKGSSKYLYWIEACAAFRSGSSILIYQHFPRERRDSFTNRAVRELRRRTGAAALLTFTTPRVLFLLAGQETHAAFFRRSLPVLNATWHDCIVGTNHPVDHQIEPIGR